jgi:hypothetical protein
MDEAMHAYGVFGAAVKSHALKVVLSGTPVPTETKSKVVAKAAE